MLFTVFNTQLAGFRSCNSSNQRSDSPDRYTCRLIRPRRYVLPARTQNEVAYVGVRLGGVAWWDLCSRQVHPVGVDRLRMSNRAVVLQEVTPPAFGSPSPRLYPFSRSTVLMLGKPHLNESDGFAEVCAGVCPVDSARLLEAGQGCLIVAAV